MKLNILRCMIFVSKHMPLSGITEVQLDCFFAFCLSSWDPLILFLNLYTLMLTLWTVDSMGFNKFLVSCICKYSIIIIQKSFTTLKKFPVLPLFKSSFNTLKLLMSNFIWIHSSTSRTVWKPLLWCGGGNKRSFTLVGSSGWSKN